MKKAASIAVLLALAVGAIAAEPVGRKRAHCNPRRIIYINPPAVNIPPAPAPLMMTPPAPSTDPTITALLHQIIASQAKIEAQLQALNQRPQCQGCDCPIVVGPGGVGVTPPATNPAPHITPPGNPGPAITPPAGTAPILTPPAGKTPLLTPPAGTAPLVKPPEGTAPLLTPSSTSEAPPAGTMRYTRKALYRPKKARKK